MTDDLKDTMPRWAVGRINSAHPAGGDRIVGYRVPEKNAPSPMHDMSMLEDLERKAARAETAERQRDEALAALRKVEQAGRMQHEAYGATPQLVNALLEARAVLDATSTDPEQAT